MRLTDLLDTPGPAVEIAGLTADSRAVGPGFLFAALAGSKTNGARFVQDAIARGAVAVLAVPEALDRATLGGVTLVEDANPRRRLALMAARFHAPQPETVAAVTGTNGKTSVTVFARQIWEHLGVAAASIGTIGVKATGFDLVLAHTTPDPVILHQTLAEVARRGVQHVALEASSHGLDQFRLDGVRIKAAAFTNLTRDHLDYHPDMAAYFAAKLRLFDALLPPGAPAIVNADSDWAPQVVAACRRRGQRLITYGMTGEDVRILGLAPVSHGLQLRVRLFGREHETLLPLVGDFQAGNALCALGLAVACGADPAAAFAALGNLQGAPGRMQHVADANGAPVFVDYAHTPDALGTALRALRPHARGRLAVVFGCGGDRDRGKRPLMGAIAARAADLVFVTDDNPRTEDAAAIRAAIMAAAPGATEIADRAAAIRAAAAILRPGDALLIAGKGHEQGQIVGHETRPFDDATEARRAAGDRP